MMPARPPRKISYEQDCALAKGRNIARANQRRRVADQQKADKAREERMAAEANHQHSWKNWDYVLNYTHEVRECRECGYAEIRPVRF